MPAGDLLLLFTGALAIALVSLTDALSHVEQVHRDDRQHHPDQHTRDSRQQPLENQNEGEGGDFDQQCGPYGSPLVRPLMNAAVSSISPSPSTENPDNVSSCPMMIASPFR